MSFESTFKDQSVLVTGHSGFTGGWLCSWLEALGAKVSGISLLPDSDNSLYDLLSIAGPTSSYIADINDPQLVKDVFAKERPEIVFHLAAQSLVSRGYDDPHRTFMTNVMGTLNVLEAARHSPTTKAIVCVTTDKVYENLEWGYGYREIDRLGGKDPYSASKAGSELVIGTYQQAMSARGNNVAIASARGGNIIGGGDWAENRIVPDFVRAVIDDKPLVLRNPNSTRPWQHVLALVHGYLVLADRLLSDEGAIGPWNFGPDDTANQTVRALIELLGRHWKTPIVEYEPGSFVEAQFLHLTSEKARSALNWRPPWSFDQSVRMTAHWYRGWSGDHRAARSLTDQQIAEYRNQIADTPE